MKKFLKKNKLKVIFFSIIGIIVILILLMLYPLYGGKSGSNYGNRLEGINDVKITDDIFKKIKDDINKNIKAKSVNINLQGKIINIVIVLDDEIIDKTTEYIPSVIELLSEKQQKFYDIQVFVSKDDVNIIGYKAKNSSALIWTNNK